MPQQNQCKRCLMDRSASEIVFTKTGCNFCDGAEQALKEIREESDHLPKKLHEIRYSKFNDKYDCLIGLSGGVDSSYLLHLAVLLGLRPFCFSVDNGYNDPKADENIMRLVEGMKVPFYRYVLNKEKFKELQSAFLLAGVPNVEIPTDHVLMAVSYELAAKHKIKWILSGGNVATESIMPASWGYNARDLVHIKAIYKEKIKKKLTGLPLCSLLKWNFYHWVKGIKICYLLDYINYNREIAIKTLEMKYGFKPYGEKHCENIFTWWFQNYYLFEKFGFDKRKAHLSSLIMSGQMTREQAFVELDKDPVYPELGIEQRVMGYLKNSHDKYPKDKYNLVASFVKLWK